MQDAAQRSDGVAPETEPRRQTSSGLDWLERARAHPPQWLRDGEPPSPEIQTTCRYEQAVEEVRAGQTPDARFAALVKQHGLERYAREVEWIESGKLPDLPTFREFRAAWGNRARAWDGAVLYGTTGAGKSVMAMWACRAVCRAGGTFAWIDAMEMPGILASDRSGEILRRLATAGLLVVDELGDAEDLRGRSWAEIKSRINLRYRADLPTILGSIRDREALGKEIGPEVLRRFALHIGG